MYFEELTYQNHIVNTYIVCNKKTSECDDVLQVPITIDVEVPHELHRLLAGQKRRELMQTYDVHILLPPGDDPSDIVKVAYIFMTKTNCQENLLMMCTKLNGIAFRS